MKEIEKELYRFSKEIDYDDDFAILFYKGEKVARDLVEGFKDNWIEAAYDYDNMVDLLNDIVRHRRFELDDADAEDTWEHIWDELAWDESSKSYKYGNWELVILDI